MVREAGSGTRTARESALVWIGPRQLTGEAGDLVEIAGRPSGGPAPG